MGHNVDLRMFGMCAIRCKKCGTDLDISEVDIEYDVSTNSSMQFELRAECSECNEENEFIFKIIEKKE